MVTCQAYPEGVDSVVILVLRGKCLINLKLMNISKCLTSFVVTSKVKFNPLMFVIRSTLYSKAKTSLNGLNLTKLVNTSEFKKDLFSQVCKYKL